MTQNVVSMTGFGRASAALGDRTISVEVRSLNHRGLDVKVRAHDLRLAPEIEIEMLRMVRARLMRGSVAVNVADEGAAAAAAGVDMDRIRQIHAALDGLRRELALPLPVDLGTVGAYLAANRGAPAAELSASCWPEIGAALGSALDGLQAMRVQEGAAMLADLTGRLDNLRRLVDRIAELAVALPSRAARRLEERLAALVAATPAIEPARLAHEVAVLAERLDVSEEIARLRAHFDHVGLLFGGQGKDTPGRRVDFLAQEIGRELNTLGGKVQDAAIAALVIDAKAELEKLREQGQNIE